MNRNTRIADRRRLSPGLIIWILSFALVIQTLPLASLNAAVALQEPPLTITAQASGSSIAPVPQPSGSSAMIFRSQIKVKTSERWQRLKALDIAVLEQDIDWALVLVDFDQLETLARLGFGPVETDELTQLTAAHAQAKPWLASALEPLLREAAAVAVSRAASVAGVEAAQQLASVRQAVVALSPERLAGIAAMTSIDDDADGLSNTEEGWWCTDPLNPDSDGDGSSDGTEVAALQDWLANRRAGPPSGGKPFAGWPPQTTSTGYPGRTFACQDDDQDSVPDMAERWVLGLNMNRESTDRDKFDDGQELFGTTYCPGSGGFCGYGALPRNEDWGVIFAEMPAWVEAPGNHPNVAAFPVIEVNLVADAEGNTFRMETVTEVTTDHVIVEGTSKSYATSKTEGTSDEISNGLTHNEWQEVSEAHAQVITMTRSAAKLSPAAITGLPWPDNWIDSADQFIKGGLGPVHDVLDLTDADPALQDAIDDTASLIEGVVEAGLPTARTALALPMAAWGGFNCLMDELDTTVSIGIVSVSLDKVAGMACKDYVELARQISPELAEFLPSPQAEETLANENTYATVGTRISPPGSPSPIIVNNNIDTRGITQGLEGMRLAYLETGEMINDRLYEVSQGIGNMTHSLDDISSGISDVSAGIGQIADILAAPVETNTNTNGYSVARSETTTHATTEAHTITNDEEFSSQESWGTATAINSAHAADLWFTYQVRNSGNEYAREIGDLVFNIYIGNDTVPAYTYFVAPDVGGDGKFHTFMPGEAHPYTAHIPLSLRQMARIDQGGTVRVIVEDYTYGIDELFYQDAVHSGIVVGIDDGTADGDEEDDSYLFPTWGEETVMDVLARYFPASIDADGDLTALWTPETRSDTPKWCAASYRTGQRLWCKHTLSTADWWQIYLSAPGDTSGRYHDAPAQPGLLVYMRFQSDSDLDGYGDRTELALGTLPYDATSFPQPELVAGVHHIQSGNQVTATLSLLNIGLDDAKIVQAVMLAPDDSITITDNTVGGSARVRSQQHISVSGKVTLAKPIPAIWTAPDHAYPAVGGDFTGSEIITYTFTVQCAETGGCGVGDGAWDLNWSSTSGDSGDLSYDDGYRSPEYLAVGPLGVNLGLISGQIAQGDSFSVVGVPARDTFKYTINADPPETHTPPIVVVSYNDARGSHRFVIPPAAMDLSSPSADLGIYRGTMLPEPGIEILASSAITLGVNTTHLVVHNPASTPLDGAHIYVEFLSMQGTVVHRVELTSDVPSGPIVLPFSWSTGAFSPAFATDEDYMVMAFLTDRQDHIIDTATQPLFFFSPDSPMKIAVPHPSADVGTVLHADSYEALATLLGASHAAAASQQSATYKLRGIAGQSTIGAGMASSNYHLATGFLAAARSLQQEPATVASLATMRNATNDVLDRFPTRCFPLVSTGRHPLKLRAVSTDPALTVTRSAATYLESGEFTEVCVRLNTDGLPPGSFDKTLPVYTSDPTEPVVELHLTGTIAASGDVVFVHDYRDEVRPLNKILHVNSARAAGEKVLFRHSVAGDTAQLHPLFVYGDTEAGTPLGGGVALGGTSARQAPGDSASTELTLPEGTSARRDYIVQYGYRADLPTGGGQTTYQVPLASQGYATVTLDIVTANLASQNVGLSLDVGADGSVEWSFSGTVGATGGTVHAQDARLTAAINTYLNGHAGGFVPIRLTTNVEGTYFLANVRGIPSRDADLIFLGGLGVSNTTPIETEMVQLCATAANNGAGDVSAAVMDFLVRLPAVNANLLVGYSALTGLAARGGQGSGCVDWDTSGFTGDLVLYGVADFLGQVPENNETNNVISTTISIRSRPDLLVSTIELSDAEPVAGQAVTVTLTLRNNGQTTAGSQSVALYNGNPDAGGTLVETLHTISLLGGATTNLTFAWTPTTPGLHRLLARADRDRQINEYDEANNDKWLDVYVGFRGPISVDAGATSDLPYGTTAGFGYLNSGTRTISCGGGAAPDATLRAAITSTLLYRFDYLLPGHFYHLDLTLRDCDGNRAEETRVDDMLVAAATDLSDHAAHRLSLLLDPALYRDRTVTVALVETHGLDALLAEISLHDVDYRYADAGHSADPNDAADPRYPGPAASQMHGKAYGWLDGERLGSWAPTNLPGETVRMDRADDDPADDPDSELRYRFDGLDPARRYRLRLTFRQLSGAAVIQKLQLDGTDATPSFTLNSGQAYSLTVAVPPSAYAIDGSILAGIVRVDCAASEAQVNEIALEEETLPANNPCHVQATPNRTIATGGVTIRGAPAPAGTVIEAVTPRDEVVGCTVVSAPGAYPYVQIYGEDPPTIPGMRDGEIIEFRVNGIPAVAQPSFYWKNDSAIHTVNLGIGSTEGQCSWLASGWNFFSFRLDPPVPTVEKMLGPIAGRYCQVRGERSSYDCTQPPVYNMKELDSLQGYWLKLEGGAGANLRIEGMTVPITTPIPLHEYWNWVGYLPTTSQPITSALQSIAGRYLLVLGKGTTFAPAHPELSNLLTLEPGQGYQIRVTETVTLVYPLGVSATYVPDTSESAWHIDTSASACPTLFPTPFLTLLYGQARLDGAAAPAGAVVEIITPRGDVAGCTVVREGGGYGYVHVYGEDATDPPIPGFRPGEPLAFRVNGRSVASVPTLAWQNDRAPHAVDLGVGGKPVYLPMVVK